LGDSKVVGGDIDGFFEGRRGVDEALGDREITEGSGRWWWWFS